MSDIGKPERATQNRVIALFRDQLGYAYLGNWSDRASNSYLEEGLLTANLAKRGYSPAAISGALHRIKTEADNKGRKLYDTNRAVYELLHKGLRCSTASSST